jgi:hypothetical protein
VNTDYSDDPVGAALSVLDVKDVSAARAARLRRRCHAVLAKRATSSEPTYLRPGWRRWLAPAIATTWSVIYVAETIRRALSVYRAS